MKMKLVGLLIALLFMANVLGLIPVLAAKAHTESDPFTTNLFAGKNIDVGDVLVWNDEDYLYVKYATTGDWYISEVHLEVATSLAGIPQAKGNPIPGKFTYGEEDLWTQEYPFDPIPLNSWTPGTTLYIAAHAKVWDTSSVAHICIVSDTATIVKERRSGDQTYFTTVDAAAVEAWEPGSNYPNDGSDDSAWEANSLWDQRIGTAYHSFFKSVGADWIWETYRVSDPVYGTVLKFERSFTINGIPKGGTLTITCDNGYEAYLNGGFVGSDNVAGDWLYSNLKQDYVDTSNWDTVEQYDVSSFLSSGTNTLLINAANEYFNTDDYGNPWLGTESNNPGGLIYALCIDYYDRCETAWGFGDPFPGKNWATYFTYTVQGWTLIETINVPADGTKMTSINDLQAGHEYKFVANGTCNWRVPGSSGGYLGDAEYWLRHDAYGGVGRKWVYGLWPCGMAPRWILIGVISMGIMYTQSTSPLHQLEK